MIFCGQSVQNLWKSFFLTQTLFFIWLKSLLKQVSKVKKYVLYYVDR